MSIEIEDDCEFITMIADLIKLIGNLDEFKLKIWVKGNETPFNFSSNDDFVFLNEGMRMYTKKKFTYISDYECWSYIFYDDIANIQVFVGKEEEI